MMPSIAAKKRGRLRRQEGLTLVEVLVSLIVLGIITTMIIVAYFALNRSYAYSVASGKAREEARQGLARMVREIRDCETRLDLPEAAIVRARERWILLYTTFNEEGNNDPAMVPGLVMFRLYDNGQIWRFEDIDRNGDIANIDENSYPVSAVHQEAERASGEGGRSLVGHVVNYDGLVSPTPALFRYSYIDDLGQIQMSNEIYYTQNRVRIRSVQIHMLVDLNPKHAPVYADLMSTAQLRNQRSN